MHHQLRVKDTHYAVEEPTTGRYIAGIPAGTPRLSDVPTLCADRAALAQAIAASSLAGQPHEIVRLDR